MKGSLPVKNNYYNYFKPASTNNDLRRQVQILSEHNSMLKLNV